MSGFPPASRRVANLARLLTDTAARLPSRTALIHGERRWSWRDLEARVSALALALTEQFAVRKGERILVQSRNCHQMLETMFACFRIGAVFVPTNFRLMPAEVAWQAKAAGAVGFVCDVKFGDHYAAVREATESLRFVIAIGESAFGENHDVLIGRYLGQAGPIADVEADDPCWFLFTSGTTGRPKAAVVTHGHMAFVVNNHLCDVLPGLDERDVSIILGPLSHGAGVHQLLQVAKGAAAILPEDEGLDPEAVWALIERWGVTNLFTVPTILKMLVEDTAVDRHDHSSLRHVVYAGSPMYATDQANALAKLGPVLVQYYGLGEVTGAITVLPPRWHEPDMLPPGSAGFVRTGMAVEIQDEQGRALSFGETGEICVIGPAVFNGYFDDPDANAKAFRNGWFRTGDVGHLDEQGFLYLTGRTSDMYISGGSNVYPREVEEHILAHPSIREVAVVGVQDAKWGEVGIAVCVLHDAATETQPDLTSWLEGKIARYKKPKRYLFWPELPRSGYGKVPKPLVRQMIADRDEGAG
jgi:fatty-acyl-CoA synthase